MAVKKVLFIEGGSITHNGDLRQGFAKLLEQKIQGNLPKIVLGGGKSRTIRKFLNPGFDADMFLLLVDLDGHEVTKELDIRANNLFAQRDSVFYMVQEMETWFLSQPDVIDAFFGADKKKKISDKLSKRNVTEISDPKEELKNITKGSKRGVYQEIKHGVELLKLLDANRLESSFADFKKLIERLKG